MDAEDALEWALGAARARGRLAAGREPAAAPRLVLPPPRAPGDDVGVRIARDLGPAGVLEPQRADAAWVPR